VEKARDVKAGRLYTQIGEWIDWKRYLLL
jgi:hypothetical protein